MFRLLIAGATGLVGAKTLKLALEDPRVLEVVAISRRPIAAHPKLKNIVLDFDKLSSYADWPNVDGAICALGTTKKQSKSDEDYRKIDIEYPSIIASIARKNGARSFSIVSSVGASIESPFSYLKRKGIVEEKLAEMGFSSLTIIRPSFIIGEREKPRSMESLSYFFFRFIEPILPNRLHSISAEQIAKALLESVIIAQPGVIIREYGAI
jgi:uncharacterized protein YbjT (DUF2867 family)